MQTKPEIVCPRCGKHACKSGHGLSGKTFYQLYKCATVAGCGYKWLDHSQPYHPPGN